MSRGADPGAVQAQNAGAMLSQLDATNHMAAGVGGGEPSLVPFLAAQKSMSSEMEGAFSSTLQLQGFEQAFGEALKGPLSGDVQSFVAQSEQRFGTVVGNVHQSGVNMNTAASMDQTITAPLAGTGQIKAGAGFSKGAGG